MAELLTAAEKLTRVQIRKADPADLEPICGIVESAYGVYVERIGRRPGPMDTNYLDEIARGRVWVGTDEEAVVGLIVLIESHDHLLIENVAVSPDRQHKGIGRALLDHAEDLAREAGLCELRLYTHEKMTENLDLYVRLGYREFERRREAGFARVFLCKALSAAS